MSKKICLLVDCLSSGGAEKLAANMSISLTLKGYNIVLVSMRDSVVYPYKGRLYNFGKVKRNYGKIQAFFKFKSFFRKESFDVIIDHRVRSSFIKELLFSQIIFRNESVIYCIHNSELGYSFSFKNLPWLAKLPHVKRRRFVAVCNVVKERLKQKLNIESYVIYNYVSSKQIAQAEITPLKINAAYIIGVGRLTTIKQFDKLIKCYANSQLSRYKIKLLILGDGPEKDNLKSLVLKLGFANSIIFLPFQENPYNLIKKAKILVLTSKVEGFPMVLIEALALNTPVIAFNCKSGPSEIINNELNGLLVEDQNETQLTEALNRLVLDNDFYRNVKNQIPYTVQKFSEEKIINQWVSFLENQT